MVIVISVPGATLLFPAGDWAETRPNFLPRTLTRKPCCSRAFPAKTLRLPTTEGTGTSFGGFGGAGLAGGVAVVSAAGGVVSAWP